MFKIVVKESFNPQKHVMTITKFQEMAVITLAKLKLAILAQMSHQYVKQFAKMEFELQVRYVMIQLI